MAKVETIDVTTSEGADKFPLETNDIYNMVEKVASQNIRSAKNGNALEDALYEYEVDKGSVVEEAVIKMAEAQEFNKNDSSRAPLDPSVLTKYFNNWEEKQFQTTTRRDDIRKICIAETSVDSVSAEIIGSLTSGDGAYDFEKSRDLMQKSTIKDYSELLGGKPSNMKGVIYAVRDMFNHLKTNNSDCTTEAYKTYTPVDDIRIGLPDKVMNLMDVTELANIFNLTKEEIFGKIVVIPVDDQVEDANKYTVHVYDRKAFGRATRLYEYGQEPVAKGRYENHYLTVDRMYFHNGLFKATKLDCTVACKAALANIITASAS